jgi:acyl carrier protein
MPSKEDTISGVIAILRRIASDKPGPITAGTRILTDLDLDSLRMIELMDSLKAQYGVDFSAPPRSLSDLRTPETIAEAVLKSART